MLKRRLVPVVLVRDGLCVQSRQFTRYQVLGKPESVVQRLSVWASDELVILNISRGDRLTPGRTDTRYVDHVDSLGLLSEVARVALMPISAGGGIRSLSDIEAHLRSGADKVVVNSQALATPDFVDESSRAFGAQCIVVSIDFRWEGDRWSVYADGGRAATERSLVDWGIEVAERGAGEILVNSIDRDGSRSGYDIPALEAVTESAGIPVIALGGVGAWPHFAEGLDAGVDAVAAANIFHHSENSVYEAKAHLYEAGYPVRKPTWLE